MRISEIAARLGRRGGLSRAKRLSKQRLREIARMGATARAESLRLAEAIRNNFDHVSAMQQLRRPPEVRTESTVSGPLPGVYGSTIEDKDRSAEA
jgi:hypothetical protein